jgi:hypothetical protein
MNTLVEPVTGRDTPANAPGAVGNREERNRQRRAWRKSPANPRNKSRGGPRTAWYDYGP